MLEMLHIHIPFQCFPTETDPVFSEYLSLGCARHKVGPALSCLCLCGNMYLGDIYDIYSLPYFDTKWRRPDH